MAPASSEIFLFEDFRLDRRGGLSRRDDSEGFAPVVIGSRALDILGVLIERAGEIVSKDEIISTVWPGTVVEDSNLTVQISALRRVLDRGRSAGSCIQTVSGRGYRFVASVTHPVAAAGSGGSLIDRDAEDGDGRPVAVTGRAAIAAAAGMLLLAVVTWWLLPITKPSSSPAVAATSIAQPLSAPRMSIVVLPFTNLGNDLDQQSFADGITEDLTTDLSRIAHSFVISRKTASSYRNKPVDTKQIGRELGVRYVVEGSVQRSGSQVRVSAQLLDAETDAHLWADRFDADISDLFALQNQATSRIANALNLELLGAEAARPGEHPDVFYYLLRGHAARFKAISRARYAEAIPLFERALTLAPDSVEAQSGLADMLIQRVGSRMSDSPAADIAGAERLIERALAASPSNPFAHFVKAQVLRMGGKGRCQEAVPEYEGVLAFNRNSTGALNGLGDCKLFIGSPQEVIPLMEQAIRLSPRDPQIGLWYRQIGRVHLLQSRVDEAILWLEKARSAMPEPVYIHAELASAYGLNGETQRAAAELAEARRRGGEGSFSSIAKMKTAGLYGVPSIRALYEGTYFVGLRKAGVPEE